VKAVGWDLITIGSVGSEINRRLEGMSLAQLGRATGRSPLDAVCDLMLEERGMVSQIIHGISGEEGDEAGIETLLSHPAGCVCTDANDFGKGRPHPAAYGTYPRVLGRYVRERKLMTLQAAIHKMTGAPAALLGLKDRGVVRKGAFADLVIFDPETVGSEATFDDPRRLATGIIAVVINGNRVLVEGSGAATPPIAARPAGKVLRRSG
jgi:N-acyl-D-amino-acid deacylase